MDIASDHDSKRGFERKIKSIHKKLKVTFKLIIITYIVIINQGKRKGGGVSDTDQYQSVQRFAEI